MSLKTKRPVTLSTFDPDTPTPVVRVSSDPRLEVKGYLKGRVPDHVTLKIGNGKHEDDS